MILKKPFAFLIKNFRKIHFLLLALAIYITYKSSSTLNYYNSYIKSEVGNSLATNYISYLTIFVLIFVLILLLIIYLLVRYKKKPKNLYIGLIIGYIAVLALTILGNISLISISNSELSGKSTRLVRDLLSYGNIFNYISIILISVRALGFDIKKFDFENNTSTLTIEEQDNEEVEVNLGIDTEKYATKLRRKLRELKYYYLENKLFILIIGGISLVLIIITTIINTNFINKIYQENETFADGTFNIKILNTYTTALNQIGSKVLTNDTSFVILQISVISVKQAKYKLDTDNFALEIKNKTFLPVKKYYSSFTDIGTGYNNQYITSENNQNYILVYNVDNTYLNKSMKLRYELGNSNLKVKLKPTNLDKTKSSTYKLTNSINFNNTFLNSGTLTINNYEINNSFEYKILEETKIISSSYNKTILKLNITTDNLNITNLINNFLSIYCIIDTEETQLRSIKNITPVGVIDSLYIEVNKKITDSSNIYLKFNLRNIEYKYLIKE